MADYIEELVKELKGADLVEFLIIYNDYIQHYNDTHDFGSIPASMVEFYNNDYKQLLDEWEVYIYTKYYDGEDFAEYCENRFAGCI